MIKIMVVDTLPAVRQVLKMQIELDDTLRVVAEADNSLAALDQAAHIQPDVVLVDLDMPGMDGMALTSELRAAAPQTPVIVLSLNDNETLRSQAVQACAAGFIVKQGNTIALRSLIRQVASGQTRNFSVNTAS